MRCTCTYSKLNTEHFAIYLLFIFGGQADPKIQLQRTKYEVGVRRFNVLVDTTFLQQNCGNNFIKFLKYRRRQHTQEYIMTSKIPYQGLYTEVNDDDKAKASAPPPPPPNDPGKKPNN